ncbi:hypothetical protein [Tropicimonas isoalkanivorans]|uniref:Uncharacterized protein n=1 Tax=Tropicimonas isoalkanivorans TaxID=441112 RepID=A0A1I1HI43_9RHOB|nr:hypothetical protein [Tropicimonas isoalkanivorans]SFC23717.1 hypothetical protein SAMN04488094_103171 [Tropicimonas isoalkanivorans]
MTRGIEGRAPKAAAGRNHRGRADDSAPPLDDWWEERLKKLETQRHEAAVERAAAQTALASGKRTMETSIPQQPQIPPARSAPEQPRTFRGDDGEAPGVPGLDTLRIETNHREEKAPAPPLTPEALRVEAPSLPFSVERKPIRDTRPYLVRHPGVAIVALIVGLGAFAGMSLTKWHGLRFTSEPAPIETVEVDVPATQTTDAAAPGAGRSDDAVQSVSPPSGSVESQAETASTAATPAPTPATRAPERPDALQAETTESPAAIGGERNVPGERIATVATNAVPRTDIGSRDKAPETTTRLAARPPREAGLSGAGATVIAGRQQTAFALDRSPVEVIVGQEVDATSIASAPDMMAIPDRQPVEAAGGRDASEVAGVIPNDTAPPNGPETMTSTRSEAVANLEPAAPLAPVVAATMDQPPEGIAKLQPAASPSTGAPDPDVVAALAAEAVVTGQLETSSLPKVEPVSEPTSAQAVGADAPDAYVTPEQTATPAREATPPAPPQVAPEHAPDAVIAEVAEDGAGGAEPLSVVENPAEGTVLEALNHAVPVSGKVIVERQIRLFAPGGVAEATVGALTAELNAVGYELRSSARVGFSISQSNVRYYHTQDAALAAALAEDTGALLRDFTSKGASVPPGTVELWLAGESGGAAPAKPKPAASQAVARQPTVRQPTVRQPTRSATRRSENLRNRVIQKLRSATNQ